MEGNEDNLHEKYGEKVKNVETIPHVLPVSNVGDIKITSLMCIMGYKIFHRKMKSNSISIRKGNIE